jgi:hypothetical protein
MNSIKLRLSQSEMTREQCKDTGMAMVLILLLLALAYKQEVYLLCSIFLHVINMTVPQVYRPLAVLWFGLAYLLGTVVSRLILSIVFLVIVTPIGVARRLMGIDTLRLKQFKRDKSSVMSERHHKYTADDIQRPY